MKEHFTGIFIFALSVFPLLTWGDDVVVKTNAGRDIRRAISEVSASADPEEKKMDRYLALLSQYADDFDPSYDQDIELDARRHALFMERGGEANPKAYVPFSEVGKWQPTNTLQAAIWELIEKTAQAFSAVHRGEDKAELPNVGLPPDLARALQYETSFCRITNGFVAFDENLHNKVFFSERDSFISPNEYLASFRLRYLRLTLEMPVLWREEFDDQVSKVQIVQNSSGKEQSYSFARAPSEAESIEKARIDFIRKLFGQEMLFSNLIACCRIAQASGTMRDFEERVNKHAYNRRGKQRGSAEGGPIDEIEIARSRYASLFSFTKDYCWRALRRSGHLSVVRDGKAARRAFIREIADLAHVGMDEAKRMDGRFEYMAFKALGKGDEYIARLSAEWERAHPAPPRTEIEKTKTTFEFGAYPVTPELQKELDLYGMTAGTFTARAAGSTNRLSYLLFTPGGKKLPPKVPLLAYIPGSGEIGGDLSRQFHQRALFRLVTSEEFQRRHPCYLLAVSPPDGTTAIFGQMPDGSPTDLEAAIGELIRGVARTRKSPLADESRLYATGFSFGATAVYGLAFAMPDLFAASIPVSTTVCDPGMVPDFPPSNYYHLYNEGDIRDLENERARLKAFGDRVRECGGDFRTGTYPVAGHNAWDAAWREAGVWDWLFSKRKGAAGAAARKSGPNTAPFTVAAVCTASRPGRDAKSGPERAADGLDGTAYVSDAPMGRGDWFQIEFTEPVAGHFTIKTGLANGKGRLARGQVESSPDGHFWTRRARFQKNSGECEFDIPTRTRFLRILPDETPPQTLAIREVGIKNPQ